MARQLERDLERRCVRLAKRRYGLLTRKMNGLGFRSWCDRLLLPPKGARIGAPVLWIEFKREGEEPSAKQALHHRELTARGQEVRVVDSEEQFERLVKRFMEESK